MSGCMASRHSARLFFIDMRDGLNYWWKRYCGAGGSGITPAGMSRRGSRSEDNQNLYIRITVKKADMRVGLLFFWGGAPGRANLPGGGAFVSDGVSPENLKMHGAVCDGENRGLSDFVRGGGDFKRRCGEDFALMHFSDNEGDNLGRPCSPPGQRSRVCIRIRPDILRTFMRR
ncbi:hypothetical protein Sfum_0849 [Syntrophobacter fumaroxidans MPOB]|uniref:Uncharacterized protein n=1 Tax=Syntrophobacter fumaroxidans (strain DSM 10017 / MPOB) TaxID=335543 RepID=A0LGJ4_SYNFM|nr:hypothetical protein Sfum_0849 [Syntrophobacter fumaroxidans MPOB]